MDGFYTSDEWRNIRSTVLELYGSDCMMCGVSPTETRKPPQVDHILARSKFPQFELSVHNMQVLCEFCNCSVKGVTTIDARSRKQQQSLISTFGKTPTIFRTTLLENNQPIPHSLAQRTQTRKHEMDMLEEQRKRKRNERIRRQKKNTFNKEKHDHIQAKYAKQAEERELKNKQLVQESLARAAGLRLRPKTKTKEVKITVKKRRNIL